MYWFLGGAFYSSPWLQDYSDDVNLLTLIGTRASVVPSEKFPDGPAPGKILSALFRVPCRCRRPSRARRTAFLACQGSGRRLGSDLQHMYELVLLVS